MKYITTLIAICCTFAALANKLIIAINPLDCASCLVGLSDKSALVRYYDKVTVVFPPMHKRDSVSIMKQFSMLAESPFYINWNYPDQSKFYDGGISHAYYFNNNNDLLADVLLKDFYPAVFVEDSKLNLKLIDTIINSEELPILIKDFVANDKGFYFMDARTKELKYLEREKKIKIFTYSFEDLDSKAYSGWYPSIDSKKLMKSLYQYFEKGKLGSPSTPVGYTIYGDTLHVAVEYKYPGGLSINKFCMLHKFVGNKLLFSAYFDDSAGIKQNMLVSACLADMGVNKLNEIQPNQRQKLYMCVNEKLENLAAQHPSNWTAPVYNKLFFVGDNNYIVPTTNSNETFANFLQAFTLVNNILVPSKKILDFKRGHIYEENLLTNAGINVRGDFPFIMLAWSNELYDLRYNKTYLLPLEIGNHDYSKAAMAKFKPKVGLAVYNVTCQDSLAYITFTMQGEKQLQYLVCNYHNNKVYYKGPLLINGKPFEGNGVTSLHFDGPQIVYLYNGAEGVLSRCYLKKKFWE